MSIPVAERTEPAEIRQVRERLAAVEAGIAEAGAAIDRAKVQVQTAEARRIAAHAKGDVQAAWRAEQAIMAARQAIEDRTRHIDVLRRERETLPAVVIARDAQVADAERRRNNIAAVERLAEIDRLLAQAAGLVDDFLAWRGDHVCDHTVPDYMRAVQRARRGSGVERVAFLASLLPDMRQRQADLDRRLWE